MQSSWKSILEFPILLRLKDNVHSTESFISSIGPAGAELRFSQACEDLPEEGQEVHFGIGRQTLHGRTGRLSRQPGQEIRLYIQPISGKWEFSDEVERQLLLTTTYFDSIVCKGRIKALCENSEHILYQFFFIHVREFLGNLQNLDNMFRDLDRSGGGNGSINTSEKLYQLCNDIVLKGERVLDQVESRQLKAEIKRGFRELCRPWMKDNPFIARSLAKPRGYPGDYMMMEMGYLSDSASAQGLSGGLDKFLFRKYRSVMCRKNKIKECLRISLAKRADNPGHIKILTLGGGPSREWLELESEMDDMSLNGRTELTYLDYDAEAVTFSEKRLKNNRLIGSLRLCCESVLNFARSEDWDDKKYSYDLIYAIGIADYFPDSILGEILARAVSLLENNGQLIIAHKDEKSFCFSALDWFCDWTFYRRDQDHFTQVLDTAISQIGGKISYRVERDETGEFMFFIVTRAK